MNQLFGKIFYLIHRTFLVRFLRDTTRKLNLVIDNNPIVAKLELGKMSLYN